MGARARLGRPVELDRQVSRIAFCNNRSHQSVGPSHRGRTAMKFALASYGTRGDIEPTIALGRELEGRGHEVRLAVSPDLVGFVESSGLTAIAYGPNTQEWVDKYRDFFKSILLNMWKPRDLIELLAPKAETWVEMSTKLMSLADGGDLLYP